MFKNSPENQMVLIRRRNGTRYDDEKMNKTKKTNISVMIWLYIGKFGKGDIFIAENMHLYNDQGKKLKKKKDNDEINSKKKQNKGFDNSSYVNMIENKAIPSILSKMDGSRDFLFVQDNSPVHTSLEHTGNTVYDVLKRNNIKFVNDWPPYSPDLHPVENAHQLLQIEVKKQLKKIHRMPKNKNQFFHLIESCWYHDVDNQKIINCFKSFEDRLKLCFIHKGNNNFGTSCKTKKNRETLEKFNMDNIN